MILSTYAFCHGDRGAIGQSRMPMARKRCTKPVSLLKTPKAKEILEFLRHSEF